MPALDVDTRSGDAVDCKELGEFLSRNGSDCHRPFAEPELSDSAHPGAWFAIKDPACKCARKNTAARTLVLTSEDGALAKLAVTEAADWPIGPSAPRRRQRGPGRQPAMRFPRRPEWPTTSSTNGGNPMNAAATPKRRWPSIFAWENGFAAANRARRLVEIFLRRLYF